MMKKIIWVLAFAVLAVGCTAPKGSGRVRVEDRGSSSRSSAARDPQAKPLGYENEGKPGYYTVRPGDTLIRIGLDAGQNWRDIGRWNQLENPNALEVGQVLRIIPPAGDNAVVAARAPATAPASAAAPTQAASSPRPPASAASAPKAAETVNPNPSEETIAWMWPAPGKLLAGFDEASNKGFDIAGKAGDPVFAAADGRVVYAGAGLRGYGNLLIIKHNNTFLTAYAHNQTLLVREDQNVKKGQKIAEMGNSDSDQVKLHFEIRRLGKPVDPAKYLPAK